VSFDRLLGQDRLGGFLRHAITTDRLAHAVLVVGPAGSGKRTLAREVGKALLCEEGAGDACDACRDCRLVEHGNHPDFGVFEREAGQSLVSVETARTLQGALALKPFRGSRKVAVLPEAHRLSEAAANCLLKTLEEPPGEAVILLTAQSLGDLLPTIRSRCQVVRMAPLSPAVIAEVLERDHGVPPDAAAYGAAMSGGSLGRALELVAPDWYDIKRWVVEQVSALTPAGVFTLTDGLLARTNRLGETPAARRVALCRCLDVAAAAYRDAAGRGAVRPIHADQTEVLPAGLGSAAADIADRLLAAQEQIGANANPGLVLDAAFIDVARRRAVGVR